MYTCMSQRCWCRLHPHYKDVILLDIRSYLQDIILSRDLHSLVCPKYVIKCPIYMYVGFWLLSIRFLWSCVWVRFWLKKCSSLASVKILMYTLYSFFITTSKIKIHKIYTKLVTKTFRHTFNAASYSQFRLN